MKCKLSFLLLIWHIPCSCLIQLSMTPSWNALHASFRSWLHQCSHAAAAWAGCPAEPGRTRVPEPWLVGERGLSRSGWEEATGWGHPAYPQSLSGHWQHKKLWAHLPQPWRQHCALPWCLCSCLELETPWHFLWQKGLQGTLHCCTILLLLLIIFEISVLETKMQYPKSHAGQQ